MGRVAVMRYSIRDNDPPGFCYRCFWPSYGQYHCKECASYNRGVAAGRRQVREYASRIFEEKLKGQEPARLAAEKAEKALEAARGQLSNMTRIAEHCASNHHEIDVALQAGVEKKVRELKRQNGWM